MNASRIVSLFTVILVFLLSPVLFGSLFVCSYVKRFPPCFCLVTHATLSLDPPSFVQNELQYEQFALILPKCNMLRTNKSKIQKMPKIHSCHDEKNPHRASDQCLGYCCLQCIVLNIRNVTLMLGGKKTQLSYCDSAVTLPTNSNESISLKTLQRHYSSHRLIFISVKIIVLQINHLSPFFRPIVQFSSVSCYPLATVLLTHANAGHTAYPYCILHSTVVCSGSFGIQHLYQRNVYCKMFCAWCLFTCTLCTVQLSVCIPRALTQLCYVLVLYITHSWNLVATKMFSFYLFLISSIQ